MASLDDLKSHSSFCESMEWHCGRLIDGIQRNDHDTIYREQWFIRYALCLWDRARGLDGRVQHDYPGTFDGTFDG